MPVSDKTPYYVYALIHENGQLVGGGGSSEDSRPRIYPSLESANRAKRYFSYATVVEYRMTNEPERYYHQPEEGG